ncbi:helix-turn-helix domain-containing protein [Micromonospora avicenniae]|uniref:helix-turn-helix domain-containing protein n=1 Tax=Micromonospora avicenniae TaxID=1198245 RepID=UPI003F5708E2
MRVAQSGLSAPIRALERDLDAELFVRSICRVELTGARGPARRGAAHPGRRRGEPAAGTPAAACRAVPGRALSARPSGRGGLVTASVAWP